jgi:hypothetical protein
MCVLCRATSLIWSKYAIFCLSHLSGIPRILTDRCIPKSCLFIQSSFKEFSWGHILSLLQSFFT